MLLTEQKLEFVVYSVAAAAWPAAREREGGLQSSVLTLPLAAACDF